jgi:hypothetical protein
VTVPCPSLAGSSAAGVRGCEVLLEVDASGAEALEMAGGAADVD